MVDGISIAPADVTRRVLASSRAQARNALWYIVNFCTPYRFTGTYYSQRMKFALWEKKNDRRGQSVRCSLGQAAV